jgi:hypothetical protein
MSTIANLDFLPVKNLGKALPLEDGGGISSL